MTELVQWEEPVLIQRRKDGREVQGRYRRMAQLLTLTRQPGRWGLLHSFAGGSPAHVEASRLRHAPLPGKWEFAVSQRDGKWAVYGRFLGDD